MSEETIAAAIVKCSESLANKMREQIASASVAAANENGGGEAGSKIRRLNEDEEFSSRLLHQNMMALTNSNASNILFDDNLHSQDSFSDIIQKDLKQHRNNKLKRNGSVNSVCSVVQQYDHTISLSADDIIVEKMNIHYGQKGKNPVDNMRFFPKHCDDKYIARRLDESNYETALPRVFEECAIRVFCRTTHKFLVAQAAFNEWCKEVKALQPFLSLSQAQNDESEDDEDDFDEGDEYGYGQQNNDAALNVDDDDDEEEEN